MSVGDAAGHGPDALPGAGMAEAFTDGTRWALLIAAGFMLVGLAVLATRSAPRGR